MHTEADDTYRHVYPQAGTNTSAATTAQPSIAAVPLRCGGAANVGIHGPAVFHNASETTRRDRVSLTGRAGRHNSLRPHETSASSGNFQRWPNFSEAGRNGVCGRPRKAVEEVSR